MASMQTALGHTAYVLDHNKKRLLILFILVGGAIGVYGIRGIFQGILDMIGQAPQLLILLLFYSFMMIVQFGVLMWFMSRPRTYTVTPDNPQIGLSFENYRGQPDLLEHAKSLVRILKGVKTFQDRGGEMPQGMLRCSSPGRPARARRSSPASWRPKRTCRSSTWMHRASRACSWAWTFSWSSLSSERPAASHGSTPHLAKRAAASCSWTSWIRSV
jgi:hypothetical protein